MSSAKRFIPFLLAGLAVAGARLRHRQRLRPSGAAVEDAHHGHARRRTGDATGAGLRQTYDVDVDVECDLKQGGEVVQQIGYDTVPANPDGRPGEQPAFGSSLVFPFRVEKAGSYVVVCFTPADAENELTTSLTVSAK